MKNFIIISLIIIVAACNNAPKPNPNSEGANPIVNEGGSANDSTADGKKLIAGNDCSGCHNPGTKLTGPSFMDISKRYPNSPGVAENLARSIIDGSKGAWSNISAMPAHNNVRYNDAVKMAAYILSLRGQARQDSLNNVR